MGYYIGLSCSGFIIPTQRVAEAAEAIKAISDREPDEPLGAADLLVWRAGIVGFDAKAQEDGSVEIEDYPWEKTYKEDEFIEALAPLVEGRAEIHGQGEEGERWLTVIEAGQVRSTGSRSAFLFEWEIEALENEVRAIVAKLGPQPELAKLMQMLELNGIAKVAA